MIAEARGRVPVIAGTGSNSTHEAIELTRLSHDAGADAMLVVAPYYNKPSQEGLFRHFCAIAETTDKPIILYSIPGRCGIEIGVAWSSGWPKSILMFGGSRKPAAALIASINSSRHSA